VQWDVFPWFPQEWQANWKSLQAMAKFTAKAALQHGLFQVAVSGGNYSCNDPDRLAAATRYKTAPCAF